MLEFDDLIFKQRKQRHDFMNDFQIIYGYLQLKRYDEAIKYIENVSEKNQLLSILYSLGDNLFAYCIEENLKRLWDKNLNLDLNIEIHEWKKQIFKNNVNKKCTIVNNIFSECLDLNFEYVCMYIYEDEFGQSILFFNDESIVDEIEWIEEWRKIDSQCNDTTLHKYCYEDSWAYKLTFY